MPVVKLISHTPNPEVLIAAAAKLCYSASTIENLMDNLTAENTEKFIANLLSYGHESPVEHVSFTFGVEGVSRSFLAQITRHRIASFSVQSQRYVKSDDFAFVTPPQVAADEAAAKIFDEAMQNAINSYNNLADILADKHYKTFIAQGKTEKAAKSAAEKAAIEDARFVLPNAAETKMIFTMNVRSLYNFFRLRCCNRAQWEIREVATQMVKLVHEVSPILFKNAGPPCLTGPCPEGKMTCGKMLEVRQKFAQLKGENENT